MAASQESMRRVGVNFEVLDGDDIRSRYPQIDPGGEVVAILEPDAGVLVAEQCVRVVVEGARRHGVTFLQESVRIPAADPSGIQTLAGTPIVAETYVFACGAWLPKVFPELLHNLMRPTRQEHFFFGVPPGNADFSPQRLPAWIDDTEPGCRTVCPISAVTASKWASIA